MPSYVDSLSEDRGRVVKALRSLIEDQEAVVGDLVIQLAEASDVLDRRVIRTLIFRSTFGATQSLTVMAETDTQEASRPVTEMTLQLERERQVLDAYRRALREIEAGAPLFQALGRFVVSS